MLALLRDLQARYNTAIIFITHDLGVIAQMASYVVVMYLGRVVEEGPVDDIFHAPKHPLHRGPAALDPEPHGRDRAWRCRSISGALPHPFNRPRRLPVPSALPRRHAALLDAAVPRLMPARRQPARELLPAS